MKRKILIVILSIIAVVSCALCFSGCLIGKGADGRGVQTAVIDDYGNLILILTDNTAINCGRVTGVDGTNGSDGANGSDGQDGVGIASVTLNDSGELIITYTDNRKVNLGKLNNNCSHSYSQWTVAREPDCCSFGYTVRACYKCGNKEYQFLQSTGHSWGEAVEIKSVTCLQEGVLLYICDNCSITKAEKTETVGHTYVDDICIYCGHERVTEGLEYKEMLGGDNEIIGYAVTGIGTATDTDVIIPSEYLGKPVLKIAYYAFGVPGNGKPSQVKSLNTGKSVTHIEESAFSTNFTIRKVVIGKSVTRVDPDAFYGCAYLNTIVWNAVNCTYTGELDNYPFRGCEDVRNIIIGENVVNIPAYAFFECYMTTELIIPDKVTFIGEAAFCNCVSLVSVTIPKSVTSIGDNAFLYCKRITNINFTGTKAEWESIPKGERWDSDGWDENTHSYTVKCTDGVIEVTR